MGLTQLSVTPSPYNRGNPENSGPILSLAIFQATAQVISVYTNRLRRTCNDGFQACVRVVFDVNIVNVRLFVLSHALH